MLSAIVTRRALLASLPAAAGAGLLLAHSPEANAATDPAVRFMQRVASSLLKAQSSGTPAAFRRVILRYADVPGIAMYCLGRYRAKLPKRRTKEYYTGTNAFMGRYFSDQAKKYHVAKADIVSRVKTDGKDKIVTTKVRLTSGTVYTVVWRLKPRGKTFKITDIKVLGFSLAYMQRGLFTAYVREKNGSINALIDALLRHR